MNANNRDHISVCICTYHRDAMLSRLLKLLAAQETLNLFRISVVVVDNDAAGPSRDIVLDLAKELGLDLIYEVEPIRMIAAARNHALRLARGNFIAMIDDDEFPPPNWLLTLFRAIQTFDVDGVLGPVHPFFEQRPPAWLTKGIFSGARAYRTGTLLSWRQTYAGNALLKAEVCSARKDPFDESFRIGGEDQVFFRDAMDAGFRFVAIEEAAVYEIVPPERWTKKYYLRRAIANGFNAHKADCSVGWNRTRVTKPLKSVVALCVYAAVLPITYLFDEYAFVRILEKGGHHLSRLLATVNVQLLKERGF